MEETRTRDLTDGLVAYYPFDETTHNSEIYDGAQGTAGKIDGCIAFDTDSRIVVDNSVVDGLGDFTFSSWVKLSELNGEINTVFSCANIIQSNELIIYYRPDQERWSLEIQMNEYQFASDTIEDFNWHHIIVIRNNTDSRLFIDGQQIGNDLSVINNTINVDSNGFIIAQEQDNLGGGFEENNDLSGFLDEFVVYNYAIDNSKISELYNLGIGKRADECSFSDYVYYNDMDCLTDMSGNDNNGEGLNGITEIDTGYNGYGSCMKFDGSDDYIEVNDHSSLNMDYFTVSGWIKIPDLPGGDRSWITKAQFGDGGFTD